MWVWDQECSWALRQLASLTVNEKARLISLCVISCQSLCTYIPLSCVSVDESALEGYFDLRVHMLETILFSVSANTAFSKGSMEVQHHQCPSTWRSQPLWGLNNLFREVTYGHQKAQIFSFQFLTIAKLQLWSSNKITLKLGFTPTWGAVFKGQEVLD